MVYHYSLFNFSIMRLIKSTLFKIFSFTLLSLCSLNSFAQDDIDTLNIKEVVISANKEVQDKSKIAQQISVIGREEIVKTNAQSSADLIAARGIAVQKSQQGGGSPMLRGFEASRVLLVIDGVRMNNIIYRAGHLQNIVTIDNAMLERVEIAYGPASTVYGSDALGGAIHFYTRNPLRSTNGKMNLKANAFVRYGTVNNEMTQHLDLNFGFKKLAFLFSFTNSNFGDLQSGRNQNPFYTTSYGLRTNYVERIDGKDSLITNPDKYLQKFSGYKQMDFMGKVLFQHSAKVSHMLNVQYSNSGNVPRYDRLTDPKGAGLNSAEWYYGPQLRVLGIYTFKYVDEDRTWLHSVTANLSAQAIEESRHNRNFGSVNLNHRVENVSVMGLNIDIDNKFKKHDLRFGIDGQNNNLKSTATQENIGDGTSKPLDTRYPDGTNTMLNAAIYATHTFEINKKIILNDGIRVGISKLHSTMNDTTFFKLPYNDISQNNTVYSGNIGIINNVNENWRIALFTNTGFRVPNVDDLSKIFETAPGRVVVPNADLKPEKTWTTDLSITRKKGKRFIWENVVFYTLMRDAIITDKFTFNGQDSIVYDNTKSAVVASQNKSKAYVYGLSSNLFYKADDNITFKACFNYTYGRIKTDSMDYPLDHVSPVTGSLVMQYAENKWSSEFYVLFNGWKKIKNYNMLGEDNEQYATVDGMPAWVILNLRAQYKACKYLMVQAGIENILDTQYRTFASGINAAGRNVYVTLRLHY
jgi:hemoglobin/transferrin/lactoferrin receptor protein